MVFREKNHNSSLSLLRLLLRPQNETAKKADPLQQNQKTDKNGNDFKVSSSKASGKSTGGSIIKNESMGNQDLANEEYSKQLESLASSESSELTI